MPTCPYINITDDSTYTNTDLAHYKWIYAYEILIQRMKKLISIKMANNEMVKYLH